MTTTIVPSIGNAPLMTQAGTGASPGYQAIDVRRMVEAHDLGEGVKTRGSFLVTQRGAGANMSVDVNMDELAHVRGDAVALQGLYYVPPHSATINETVAASDPTNPRIDRVILEVQDNVHDASGGNLARTRVITGTPSSGATLDNLTGAAAVPNSAVLLADVLVPATSTTVVDANIRDRRPVGVAGAIPPLLTDLDAVSFMPAVGTQFTTMDHTIHDLNQASALMRLSRRIASATRIRWRYIQGGTPITGNYVIAIYDASGRKIIDTGTVAFTGAANSSQIRSETITATTFEPGNYYVLFGMDSAAVGTFQFWGVPTNVGAYFAVDLGTASATGGVTAPTTLLGATDASAANNICSVPMIALSVG